MNQLQRKIKKLNENVKILMYEANAQQIIKSITNPLINFIKASDSKNPNMINAARNELNRAWNFATSINAIGKNGFEDLNGRSEAQYFNNIFTTLCNGLSGNGHTFPNKTAGEILTLLKNSNLAFSKSLDLSKIADKAGKNMQQDQNLNFEKSNLKAKQQLGYA